ncbi:hypothetical protein DL766_000567 [Monosporascus sp. MC13-8B]|uniref:3-hydroxyphenylacetate 6-hydroxylase n=1 Tax=Monosporascus cannonballus TaxID=155416 RepID=A0ABY0GT95_9PEZI|nr:hypothetical protein DL762_010387 [Monosporascus cannonballus]RYO99523.1 hypothetical protein DL763_001434 [Monosporascus cannonballus]RYP39111.1 hypothetical protein DL766_000567 [Monosporascus sp. MC13-8B]
MDIPGTALSKLFVNIYWLYLAIWVLIALVFYLCVNEVVRSRSRITGFGGPKGLPVLGNLLDVLDYTGQKYQQWAKTFGSVYQIQLANTTIVVVNSASAAKKLFISNSQALSSRPITYTFGKIASSSSGLTIGTSPYDDSLKRKKKGAASALNRPSIQTYVPYLDRESRTFLEDLLHYGKGGTIAIDPLPLIQRLSLSLVMTINWGVRMPSHEDELFKEITEVEEELNRFRSTVGNLQDHIPLLRLNPFNRTSTKARGMRRRRDRYLNKLNADLAEKVAKGTDKPCIQANVLKDTEAKLNEAELRSISLSILGGGFETVSNTVQWTIGYLALHPEIQDKAFEAIREFQGSDDQLCDAADDLKCTYVAALAKEALRYFTVVPLALPRESIRDVEYEGCLIPTGTTVYLNAWAYTELWSDPGVFRPERWIENPDAPLFTFGLGYRMCTAHILAYRELYLVFMRMLRTFRLEACGDVPCNPRSDMKNPRDLIMSPKPYRVFCVPRNREGLKQALVAASAGDEE